MSIFYTGRTALAQLVSKTTALVEAVRGTAESALTTAQTASAEAKFYGTCTTTEGVADKVVTCDTFVLRVGAKIAVRFTNRNSAVAATLNVNDTGAKPIEWLGTSRVGGAWTANEVCNFIYDGTNFVLMKSAESSSSNLVLKDSVTTVPYMLVIEDGVLTLMEMPMTAPVSSNVKMLDRTTGLEYLLIIEDGILQLEEV